MSIPTPRPRLVGEILWTCVVCCLMVGIAHSQTCDTVVGHPPSRVILGDDGVSQFFPKNRNCPDNIVPPRCIGGTILRHVDPADPDRLTLYACLAWPENGQDLPLLVHIHGSTTPTVDTAFSGFLGQPPNTELLARMNSTSLAPNKVGYVLLMPQGRCLAAPDPHGFRVSHEIWFRDAENNIDVRAALAFIQQVHDRTTLDAEGNTMPLPDTLATVNRKRVYLTGHSNGAFFAHMLGLMFPDQFAAVATAAGADPFAQDSCPTPYPTTSRKIPLMVIHATCDPAVFCDCSDCSADTPAVQIWLSTLSKRGWGDEILQNVITDTSHVQILRTCEFAASSRQRLCPISAHAFPNPRLPDMLNFLRGYELP